MRRRHPPALPGLHAADGTVALYETRGRYACFPKKRSARISMSRSTTARSCISTSASRAGRSRHRERSRFAPSRAQLRGRTADPGSRRVGIVAVQDRLAAARGGAAATALVSPGRRRSGVRAGSVSDLHLGSGRGRSVLRLPSGGGWPRQGGVLSIQGDRGGRDPRSARARAPVACERDAGGNRHLQIHAHARSSFRHRPASRLAERRRSRRPARGMATSSRA